MKEKIINLLKKQNKALTFNEINDLFGFKTTIQLKQLSKQLVLLERDNLITVTKKNKYILKTDKGLKVGKLAITKKGFGYVLMVNEPDIKIKIHNLKGAIHDDIVAVKLIALQEGKVVKIIKRDLEQLVGEYQENQKQGYLKLEDPRYNIKVLINPKTTNNVVSGHQVVVKIERELEPNVYEGSILKVLGHKNDPGVDILCILYQYNIKVDFEPPVIAAVETIPTTVRPQDLKGRCDLRQEIIFTMDGASAKDLDDAISIIKLNNGNYKLGVHIADVSYYVKENSALAESAYERGNSIYLVDRVIPMLPPQLANGICSLNENEDRLTITCAMEINPEGFIINHEIYESVIKSKKRMVYEEVNYIIKTGEMIPGYESFLKEIEMMVVLAKSLRKNKEKRGFIDFALKEMEIIVNKDGTPLEIKAREQGVSENIIEDFMIAANETVAHHITNLNKPFLYRVHEYPKLEKVRNFVKFVNLLGYKLKIKDKKITPHTIQSLLKSLETKKEFPILTSLLLQSMQKAIYQPENVGHFGLASKCYTHFTAPIRRYSDLIVHRLLREYSGLEQNKEESEKLWLSKLAYIGEHISAQEGISIECERVVANLKAAEYMESHIGESYEGIIAGMISIGMFVQLNNLIEGLVHISELGGDYYYFDEGTMTIRGRRTNKYYRLGERVLVEVISASKLKKTIDFKIIKKIK